MPSPSLSSMLGAAATLAAMTAIEVVGLRSGTAGLILLGGIAVLVIAMLALRLQASWIGVGAACAAAFTLSWNGVAVGPLRVGDVLVLVALVSLVVGNPNDGLRSPPWWIKQVAAVLVLLVAILIFLPPDLAYLSQRTVVSAGGHPSNFSKVPDLAGTNIFVAFKFIVAVAAIPMVFGGAARVDRRAARWLAIAFATGSGLSGAIAFADHLGANFGVLLTGSANVGDRQAGFSDHPNFLAAGLVLAIPVAFWLLLSRIRYDRLIGAAAMAGCLGGVFASGSRGGAVTAAVAIALSVLAHRRTRAHALAITLFVLVAAGVVGGVIPSVGALLLKVTRLNNPAATIGSDQVRAISGAQGVRDFLHSPLHGVGLQVSFDASEVYLQELASGGLLLFLAMQVYMVGGIVTATLHMRRSPLAAALLVSLVATVILNFFEADLTDRFYYVPAAILIALLTGLTDEAEGMRGASAVETPSAAPAVKVPDPREVNSWSTRATNPLIITTG